MTYTGAVSKIRLWWLIGTSTGAVSLVSTIISSLKMFIFASNEPGISQVLMQPIVNIGYSLYQHTPRLKYFWDHSPVPSLKQLKTYDNLLFVAIYILIFIGSAYIQAARGLSTRLAAINKQIEDQIIKDSITGGRVRGKVEIRNSIPISASGLFCEFNKLYLAPITVGVLVLVIAKFTGLT